MDEVDGHDDDSFKTVYIVNTNPVAWAAVRSKAVVLLLLTFRLL